MSAARDAILARIRAAREDGEPEPVASEPPRGYRAHGETSAQALVEQLVERLLEYRASVRRATEMSLDAAIGAALQERGVRRLVVPADLPNEWLPKELRILRDSGKLSPNEVGECDGVLTGCALAIAQTGTLALDHGARQGRRLLSLLPDYHLCVLFADQIVGLVPEAMPGMEAAARAGRPLTLISGPSATSDIELSRVEGVHGPRTLEVVVVESRR